ncbi:ScbR family autoregulator-binding transcription factor [Streptomyces anthocyanicus]
MTQHKRERAKQERAIRTREQLLRAAAEVFDASGYAGASINRILDRAELTAGAMYFHFKSKEDLARAVILEQATDVHFPRTEPGLQQVLDMTGHLATEIRTNTLLRAGIRLAVDTTEESLREFAIYDYWVDQFRSELVEAHARGELHPFVDATAAARLVVASFTGTQIMSRAASNWADLPALIADLWHCLLPAFAPADVIGRLTIPNDRNGATA